MKEININNFEEKLYFDKLDNGLLVYLVPLKNKKNFYVSFGTKYGNYNSKFKVNNKIYEMPSGIAHFLEHKLFEKEKENPFDFYAKSGTDVNAGTSIFYTNYYFTGNNNYNENLKYLLKFVTNLEITEKDVEKEKGIILEEARMVSDNPNRLLYDKTRENAFFKDPYKYKVIGEKKEIKSITKKNLEICFNAFYRPDNMFIIAVGNIDKDETIKIIKEELKDFKNDNKKIEKLYYEEDDEVFIPYEEIKLKTETTRLSLNYKINKNTLGMDEYKREIYLGMMLTLVLGSTSLAREKLQEKNLCTEISTNLLSSHSHYLIGVTAVTENQDKLINELRKIFKNIKISKKDFERIKKVWVANEIKSIDNISATSSDILTDIIDLDEYKNDKIKDIQNLSYEELINLIKKIDFENLEKTNKLEIVVISKKN